jgi:hypothetical protein
MADGFAGVIFRHGTAIEESCETSPGRQPSACRALASQSHAKAARQRHGAASRPRSARTGIFHSGQRMSADLEKVRHHARDLRTQEPRGAHEELAGMPMGKRTLDKCRASLLGHEGDFRFGCPMDEQFFREAGVSKDEFRSFVATGANDDEVAGWLKEQK